MRFLREEEKLARDVYLTLHEKWKLPIFSNISKAEQRHMNRMGVLLARYGVKDPVVNDATGEFSNKELAALYKELVARGSKSVVEALLVGATIEDLDIRDIRRMKLNTSDANALDAFAKLECGSGNHMRAFTAQLAARGEQYRAKYLTHVELDQIVSAQHERCGQTGRERVEQRRRGAAGQGRGFGRGRGGPGHGGGHSCNH